MAVREKNPCFGCTMLRYDKWYACPIYDNTKDLAELLYYMCEDMDFGDYEDTKEESINSLSNDISKAKEFGLDSLVSVLECICMSKSFGYK